MVTNIKSAYYTGWKHFRHYKQEPFVGVATYNIAKEGTTELKLEYILEKPVCKIPKEEYTKAYGKGWVGTLGRGNKKATIVYLPESVVLGYKVKN